MSKAFRRAAATGALHDFAAAVVARQELRRKSFAILDFTYHAYAQPVNTFNDAAKAAVLEALRRAGNLVNLSAQTNIRTAYLVAYKSGMTVVPEEHLRVIHDYLKRAPSVWP